VQPHNCTKSDRFDYATPGCGVCTPCDPALLPLWQCFNGDGQCGATYFCGFTTVARTTAVLTTVVQTTPPPATTAPPTTAAASSTYATLMTVTLADDVALADLLRSISCPDQCTVQIVSVMRDCKGCRRLLASLMTVEVVILSAQPLSPTLNDIQPVSVITTASHLVTDVGVLGDASKLGIYVKESEQRHHTEPRMSEAMVWLVSLVCGMLLAVLIVCFVCRLPRKAEPVAEAVVNKNSRFIFDSIRIKTV
jgi:hypothetical protein